VTPLVLLHGFLGCAGDWDDLIGRLEPARDCLAPDLPGHGADPAPIAPGPRAFDETVERVAALIEARFDEPVDLLGYSMGGRLALGLVADRPDLLRRAAAVGASPGIDDEIERRTRKRDDDFRARSLERGPLEAWLDDWYAQPLFGPLRASPAFAAMRARRAAGDAAALARALRALSPGIQPPLRHRLSQSTVPLLLIAGALDAKYAAIGRDLAAASPSIRDAVVPGAGHAPHLEQPDEFLRIVHAWFDGP
jgi:2-succinyl-6-hydroxy-2,4-cyclohexadiene-1-carboxylate synthase